MAGRVYYRFTLQEIEERIEAPTQVLHGMCLDLVADVVESEALMTRLALPPEQFDTIRQSFRSGERALYGRFDLAYDGRGPAKLLEYNADTPTGVFEAAYFQYEWLIDQIALGRCRRRPISSNLIQKASFRPSPPIPPTASFTSPPSRPATRIGAPPPI